MGMKIVKIFKELNPAEDFVSIISLILFFVVLVGVPSFYGLPINYICAAILAVLYFIWLYTWSSASNIIRNSPVELSDKWFKEKYESYIEPFNDKYSFEEELYTATYIDGLIHEFLLDDKFLPIYEEWYKKIKDDLNNFNNALLKLDKELPQDFEVSLNKLELIKKAEEINKKLTQITSELFTIDSLLKNGNFEKLKKIDFEELYDSLKHLVKEYEKLEREIDFSKIDLTGDEEEIDKTVDRLKEIIAKPASTSFRYLNNLGAIKNILSGVNEVELHLLGNAGVGKSYIVNSICKERLEKGWPVLIVSGRKFSKDSTIEEQLKTLLDISSSWQDFLDTLDEIAISKNIRIPIIIDGLNETTFDSAFSNLWSVHLKSFIRGLKSKKNIVLITTCRESYKDVIWGGNPVNYLSVDGFDSLDVESALEKYFKFYKIEAKIGIASLDHFRNPLYIRIFCEITNRDRKVWKKINLGQKTFFQIFNEYLNISNKNICNRLDISPSAKIVHSTLYKMAKYIWENNERDISFVKLVEEVEGKPFDKVKRSKSIVFAIEEEGLLICRDFRESEEVLYFTYDLFGGYIIAKYLLHETDDLELFINSEKTTKSLFNEDYKTLHPLYNDISRCLAALMPIETGSFLSDFSDKEVIIQLSLEALFEIPSNLIDKDSKKFLEEQFKNQDFHEIIFSHFRITMMDMDHPFNSDFFSDLLQGLDMAERDISWTEYIRSNDDIFEADLKTFDKICNSLFSEDHEDMLRLYAIYIMWILTSTVRSLRDKATKSLYVYGRTFPRIFFDLVQRSLEINDPYVSERMLAATYGISMAEQHNFKDASFSDRILPLFGKNLYNLMFKKDAPFSTTHILSRDYSKKIIEIALIHHPNLLYDIEKARIVPPFKDGGIRKWSESEDKDKGKYSGGNVPLNDLIYEDVSLLGKGMDKHKQPPEYKKAKRNLWWRIYQLGYSLEIFGDVDKEIVRDNQYGRYANREIWANPYGRKYVLIAIHELAGFRDDNELLRSSWENKYQNLSFVDIDPSFPVELNNYDLVGENLHQLHRFPSVWKFLEPILRILPLNLWNNSFIGNPNMPIDKWISNENIPNINGYLIMDKIEGQEGPWVLLDGYINYEDSKLERNLYIFPRGILFNSNDEKELLKKLNTQNLSHRWLPEIPEDHYTYAGEIPWSETFDENEWDELSFPDGTKKVAVSKERFGLFKDGRRLSKIEESEFWENLTSKCTIFYKDQFMEYLPKIRKIKTEDKTSNTKMNTVHGKYGEMYIGSSSNPKEELEKELESNDLQMKMVDMDTKEKVEVNETYKVLIPVKENTWEDYHSPIITSRNVTIPNKQIAESLDLCNQPQTFDLFEKDGSRASITIQYNNESLSINQEMTYLRQDLLDQYLNENNLKFIWGIWGAKEYYPEDLSKIHDDNEFETEKPFWWIKNYG